MSASADLICIHPGRVPEVWPLVADRLRAAVLRTDLNHTADLEALVHGDGLLWVAVDGGKISAAAVAVLVKTDRNLVCVIVAVGGENMGRWLDLLAGIEAWAKAEGAAKTRIYGRKGWARVLKNYRVSNVILERLL